MIIPPYEYSYLLFTEQFLVDTVHRRFRLCIFCVLSTTVLINQLNFLLEGLECHKDSHEMKAYDSTKLMAEMNK